MNSYPYICNLKPKLAILNKGGQAMTKEMKRREFLKVSAAAGAMLIGGNFITERGSIAHGAVKIPEAEKITITIITDNYYDVTVPSQKIARRYGIQPGTPIEKFGDSMPNMGWPSTSKRSSMEFPTHSFLIMEQTFKGFSETWNS